MDPYKSESQKRYEIRKGGIGHNKIVPGGIPVADKDGNLSMAPDNKKEFVYAGNGMTVEQREYFSKLLNNIPPPLLCGHEKEIENLRGHIRRLEKSNQELGEKLHKLTKGEGWNKNT